MSFETVLLPKFSPGGTIDLAKEQFHNSYMSSNHTVMEVFNITNRTACEQLQNKLIRHEGRHSERSAANNELYVAKEPRINCTGFSYLGPKLYNMLTTDIKSAKSIEDFKNKLIGWIWKNIH